VWVIGTHWLAKFYSIFDLSISKNRVGLVGGALNQETKITQARDQSGNMNEKQLTMILGLCVMISIGSLVIFLFVCSRACKAAMNPPKVLIVDRLPI
jgi:hypothetical protein